MKPRTLAYDVIVIGGGAAGMMAAGTAALRGKRVLLLEKNAKLGEKLAISGGRRCNILNAESDEKKLLAHYGSAEQFLYSAFSKFGMEETYTFFESRGLPLKVEAKQRAFPLSERAVDVVNTLRAYLAEGRVQIKLNSPVTRVKRTGSSIEYVEAEGKAYSATSYIFATGGLSRPTTGSTGDGFAWLTQLGHTVEVPTPTIVPLKAEEKWVKDIAGVSVPDVKISFLVDGVRSFSKTGPILFTHTGISGPTVLNASGKVAALFEQGEVAAHIDFFPATDLGTLDEQLTDLFNRAKNKDLKNVFKGFAPAGMSGLILSLVPEIHADEKVNGVTKEARRKLLSLLKDFPLTITGLAGFEKAIVADGGVPLTELDMRTMRSKKVENLFIVGDLLHISRPSGGFSLQLCWTTGYVAGTNA
jgi:predicted Rossmann fold flavoprotein